MYVTKQSQWSQQPNGTKYPTHYGYYFLGASFGFWLYYIVHSIFHYFIDCAGRKGPSHSRKLYYLSRWSAEAFKIKTVDPYLIIQIRHSKDSTMHIDAADKASWNDLDVEFPISQSSISDGHKLMIAVMDDNIGLKDNHIGQVEFPWMILGSICRSRFIQYTWNWQ